MGPTSSLAEDVVGQLGREGGDLAARQWQVPRPGLSRLFRLFVCLGPFHLFVTFWPLDSNEQAQPEGEADSTTCIVHLSFHRDHQHPVRRGPKMTLICDMYLFLGIGNRDGRMGCPAPPNRYSAASRSSSSAAPRLRGLTGLSGFKLSLIACKSAVSLVFPCKGTQVCHYLRAVFQSYADDHTSVHVHTRPGFSAPATSQGLPYPAVHYGEIYMRLKLF
ncbi:hypothetical protein GE21DRAFT_1056722 [Neurospora crassa]|nr:hypothetical protein GE21DRAFT_1056722 [Neurospora crassa]